MTKKKLKSKNKNQLLKWIHSTIHLYMQMNEFLRKINIKIHWVIDLFQNNKKPAFVVFAIFAILSLYVGITMPPKHAIQKVSIDLQTNTQGQSFYMYKGKPIIIDTITPIENAKLTRANVDLAKKNNTDLRPANLFLKPNK